jgi:alkylation response protein AidB-like acyl-CoA dehydrogenase
MGALGIDRADFLREDEIVIFEKSVEKFLDEHAPPACIDSWRREGIVERSFWREAGKAGLLCLETPDEYGGPGGDFRHEVVLMEAVARRQVSGSPPRCTTPSSRPTSCTTARTSRRGAGCRRWRPANSSAPSQ